MTSGFVIALMAAIAFSSVSRGAVIYSTVESTYAQNFDGLPTNIPGNNPSIETVYTDRWQDDVDMNTSAQSDISIPSWYL